MKTFLELYSDISELKVVDKAARRKAAEEFTLYISECEVVK